jgi:hypothetical protein
MTANTGIPFSTELHCTCLVCLIALFNAAQYLLLLFITSQYNAM